MNLKKYVRLFIFALICWTYGCSTEKQPTNPIEGWKLDGSTLWDLRDTLQINKAILGDVLTFVKESGYGNGDYIIQHIYYYENGLGKHAVKLEAMRHGNYWSFVLIYDSANTRIQATKYITGHYSS